MKFSLTKFLGDDCHSLSLDDEEDCKTLDNLFVAKLNEIRFAEDRLTHIETSENRNLGVSTRKLETCREFYDLLVDVGILLKLPQLRSWASSQYSTLDNIIFNREMRQ